MHIIIQSYLNQFSKERGIETMDEADRFERFVNHCIVSNLCPTRFDVEDITTGEPEVGIDGIAILVGDDLVTTAQEATNLFAKRHRDLEVKYIFVQAKRSEGFDRDTILNMGSAIRDVLSDSPTLPRDAKLDEAAAIHSIVIQNVNKLRYGQPDCIVVYATTGEWKNDQVLEATRSHVQLDLGSTRFFHVVEFRALGFDELRREWMSTRAPAEAKFSIMGELPMPPMEGVSEAILLLVSADEFVRTVLSDEKGILRSNVFDQNVRH